MLPQAKGCEAASAENEQHDGDDVAGEADHISDPKDSPSSPTKQKMGTYRGPDGDLFCFFFIGGCREYVSAFIVAFQSETVRDLWGSVCVFF